MDRVMVTGSTGFVGKYLIAKLEKNGCKIFRLNRSRESDILNKNCYHHFKDIDTVFHLAAVVGYAKVTQNPIYAYRVNVNGTINILEFCRKNGAKLIFPSTFVYSAPFKRPKKETDPVCPTNLYTHSKYLAELYCQTYARNYGLDVTIARTSNAYGPDQEKQYIIPLIVNIINNKLDIPLNNPQAKRDFIYVDDIADAYIALAKAKTKPGDIFNVSTGNNISLQELVNLVKRICGSKHKVRYSKSLRKNEVMQNLMDSGKIKKITGWQPKVSFEKGLELTIPHRFQKKFR